MRGGDCHTNPHDRASSHGEEHKRSATEAFHEGGAGQREHELKAGISEINVGLCDILSVAGSGENSRQEVRQDAIASPLCEDRKGDIAGQAVAAGASVEEGAVVPPALVLRTLLAVIYNLGRMRYLQIP